MARKGCKNPEFWFSIKKVLLSYQGIATDITITPQTEAQREARLLSDAIGELKETFVFREENNKLLAHNRKFYEINAGVPDFALPGKSIRDHVIYVAVASLANPARMALEECAGAFVNRHVTLRVAGMNAIVTKPFTDDERIAAIWAHVPAVRSDNEEQ